FMDKLVPAGLKVGLHFGVSLDTCPAIGAQIFDRKNASEDNEIAARRCNAMRPEAVVALGVGLKTGGRVSRPRLRSCLDADGIETPVAVIGFQENSRELFPSSLLLGSNVRCR
ncbi:MAG: hypothetical protein ACLPND_20915, partial [Candidatus Korobacteraceae bacterium]